MTGAKGRCPEAYLRRFPILAGSEVVTAGAWIMTIVRKLAIPGCMQTGH